MAQLFVILASLNTLALLATGVVGALNKRIDADWGLVHFLLGLFTVIGTLLLHCIIFTYFLGTGRWVKEVGLAYRLPDAGWPKQTRELKRTVFPAALFAMLIGIAGAASGTGVQLQVWPGWLHLTLVIVTLVVHFWACGVEYRCLKMNAFVLEAVMTEVERIRAERGLPSSAEALLEQ